MKKNIVAGIDIGNSAVKTIIAEFKEGSARPQILGTGLSSSNGLRRGVVIDMTEAVEDLKRSVAQAENSAGIRIKKAYASISGPHIRSQVSRGVIAVSRADNEISENDIQRVLEAASTISLPPNREIIHRIPKKFIVDGQEFFKNPVGMTGIRLEADVIIVDALTPYLKSLAKVINENEIEVTEFIYSPLASAKAVLNKKTREHGAASLDFGGGLCHLAVFDEGELIHTASLPLGSKNITNDLAIAIKTSLDNAEMVKLEYGFVGDTSGGKKENIDLSKITDEEMIIPKKIIGEVINDRTTEIVDMVSGELKKINRLNLLPGGILLCGGGAKLTGFTEYIKEKLKLPAKKFSSYDFEGVVNKIDDPTFACAAGLVLWGFEKEFSQKEKGIFENFGSHKTFKKLKDWFRIFLP
ncbi:MAG: cell division protein FtsA [Parcubacteria group bacterium RIFCSPHIGHO2_02_FULL_40_12]|nr:MAG: cell division protein FtsA [Parcubacteria group bacterium RIFCSPHIGHO2_02_FULL_40_12]